MLKIKVICNFQVKRVFKTFEHRKDLKQIKVYSEMSLIIKKKLEFTTYCL